MIRRNLILFCLFASLMACQNLKQGDAVLVLPAQEGGDTLVLKASVPVEANSPGLYSRTEVYTWLKGRDSLGISMTLSVAAKDSMLYLIVHHQKQLSFASVSAYLKQLLPLLQKQEDFSKLRLLYLEAPIYYPDLSRDLTKVYAAAFGQNLISYQNLDPFLLGTDLTRQLNTLLAPFHRRVWHYGMEKFQLVDRKNYPFYIKDGDFSDYPDFVLNGLRLQIVLQD